MSQVRKQKPAPKERQTEQETPRAAEHEEAREKVQHSDEFLDEVDDLLEEVGMDTATKYVQQGGE